MFGKRSLLNSLQYGESIMHAPKLIQVSLSEISKGILCLEFSAGHTGANECLQTKATLDFRGSTWHPISGVEIKFTKKPFSDL